MNATWDLVVVGAGPGGLAAAVTAASAGMRVCVIDDNLQPGGQIWRAHYGGSSNSSAARCWLRKIASEQIALRLGSRVISSQGAGTLRVDGAHGSEDLTYSLLILAPGARELMLPFPGWTFPGVYGAGGLQSFVKSGLSVEGKRVIVAGTGPLLLAVAEYLRSAGARIVAVVEQAPLKRLVLFARSVVGHPGKIMQAVRCGVGLAGVPLYFGSWVAGAEGTDALRRVLIQSGTRLTQLAADILAVSYHLVPNTELPQLLGCKIESGFVQVDAMQRTSVEGIYCVGEATGIGGWEKAQLEGRIAALAASGQIDKAGALLGARHRQLRFAEALAATYSLREELRAVPQPETLLCRCEDVSHGAVAGCDSWREAKLHTRCGMGACQGRTCAPAAQFLFGWEPPIPRPPIFPVALPALLTKQLGAAEDR